MRRNEWLLVAPLLLAICCAAGADDLKPADKKDDGFVVRVVDEQGQPVAGAKVNVFNSYDRKSQKWQDDSSVTSDAEGMARFREGRGDLDVRSLIARRENGNLVGVASLPPDGPWDPPPTVVLYSACRVSGQLVCTDLEKRGRSLDWSIIYVLDGERFIMDYIAYEGDFQLSLPPGDFTLNTYGKKTREVNTNIHISKGHQKLKLDPIDLPATRLAVLDGEPTPELRGVVAWKNGPAVQLADFKGKYVILDFWGYWCGPCVANMPELIELYDKYKNRGLTIVGVHVDLPPQAGREIVDTVAKLDAQLADVRRDLWKGRDLPFPVALVLADVDVPHADRSGQRSDSLAVADFGIRTFPTQILIDPQGRIVGGSTQAGDDWSVERLEKLLAEMPAQ